MHTSIRTPMVELSAGMLKADTGAPKRGAPSIHQGGNYEHYFSQGPVQVRRRGRRGRHGRVHARGLRTPAAGSRHRGGRSSSRGRNSGILREARAHHRHSPTPAITTSWSSAPALPGVPPPSRPMRPARRWRCFRRRPRRCPRATPATPSSSTRRLPAAWRPSYLSSMPTAATSPIASRCACGPTTPARL